MRYLVPLILVVAVVGVVWLGLSTEGPQADFTFVNRGTIFTLDPAAMSWMQDIRVAVTIWEGLYSYDAVTSAPIPACALPVEISDDGLVYTFRIRPEARWSNGDPVTADDFIFAWRRAVEPGTAKDYAFFFNDIAGIEPYTKWRLEETARLGALQVSPEEKRRQRDAHLAEADRRFAEEVGLRSPDPKTLVVTLRKRLPYFLDLCAFSTFLPVHRKTVEPFQIDDPNGMTYYSEQWVKPDNAVYNGAFMVTQWVFKRHLLMERNPHYWDAASVRLNSIRMVDVEDPNTAWLLYAGGRADFLTTLDTVYAPKLIAQSDSPLPGALNHGTGQRDDIHLFSNFGTFYYNINCTPKLPDGSPNPFQDLRVRQAFVMATDKQALVDRVIRTGNPIATSFVPPGSIPGYPLVEGLPFDPDRARELLAEAGYPGGKGFPQVVVLFSTGAALAEISQALLKMWSSNLGVSGRVEGKEGKTFREDKSNTNFVLARGGWYGDYGDPTTFLDMFATGNGNNDSGYSDPRYDALLEEAKNEPDPALRLEKLAGAERYLMNEGLPILPLYQYVNTFCFDPDKVRGLHLNPRLTMVFKNVEVTR